MADRRAGRIRVAVSRNRARTITLVGPVARGNDTDTCDYDFVAAFLPEATLFDIAGDGDH